MANYPGINVINASHDFQDQSGIQFQTPVKTAQVNTDLASQAIAGVSQATQANRQTARAASELLAGAKPGIAVRAGTQADLSGFGALSAAIMQELLRREEARKEQAGIDYLQEASDFATNVPERYNEKGQFVVRQGINELVDKYQAEGVNLSILANGLAGMAGPLDQAMAAKTAAQARAAAELAASERERQLATETYGLIGTLGALQVPGITSDRQQALMGDLLTNLQASMSRLDPVAANSLATSVYTALGEASALSSRTREEIQSKVSLSADYYNRASVLYQDFQSGALDYAGYSTQLSLLASNYPDSISAAFQFGALPQQINALAAQTLSLQQSTQAIRESAIEGELEGYDLTTINIDNAKYVSSYLIQHAGMIDGFEAAVKAHTGGVIPAELVAVISAARGYEKYATETAPMLWQDVQSKRSDIAQFQQRDLESFLSMYRRLQSMTEDEVGIPTTISKVRDALIAQAGVSSMEELVTLPRESIDRLQAQYDGIRQNVLAQAEAEAAAAYERYVAAGAQYSRSGLVQLNPTTGKFELIAPPGESPLTGIIQELQSVSATLRAVPTGHGGLPPNFSIPQLHSQVDAGGNRVVFPLRPQASAIEFTPGMLYGAPREYRGGTHQGLDFATPIGTEVVSYMSGQVVQVAERGGYGKTVKVKADDGTYHFFAHLDSYNVAVGARVVPGQVLAYTGETGYGTGPHLHWEVTTESESGHIDPLEYARRIPQQMRQWRGSGGNPVSYDGTIPLDNGSYVASDATAFSQAGRGAVAASDYSVTNPVRFRYASSNAADYKDVKPSHNYGYKALTQPDNARTLYSVGTYLGIPPQWIADLIAVETDNTWDPSISNNAGTHFGLIQLGPGARQDLKISVEALRRMSIPQQLVFVQNYLQQVQAYAGPITSPEELVVGVLHGMGALRQFKANPRAYDWNSNHAGLTLTQYMNKMGSYVGRAYNHPRRRVATHTSYVQGCAVCEQSMFGGFFVPHENVE